MPARAYVQLYLLLTNRGGLDADVVTKAVLAVVTKKQLQILRGVREVSTRVRGPALLESKLPLIQEDGRQDNMGDNSEE